MRRKKDNLEIGESERTIKLENEGEEKEKTEETGEMGAKDLREMCKDIIQRNIRDNESGVKIAEEKGLISIERDLELRDSESGQEKEIDDEEAGDKTQEILAIFDKTAESKEAEPSAKHTTEPAAKTKQPTATQQGGYYSRYQSKKAKQPHSVSRKSKDKKDKRKVNRIARFSSRQIKKKKSYALGSYQRKDVKGLDQSPTRSNGPNDEGVGEDDEIPQLFGRRGRGTAKPGEVGERRLSVRSGESGYMKSEEGQATGELRRGREDGSVGEVDENGEQVVKRRKRRNSLQKKVNAQRQRQLSLQPLIAGNHSFPKKHR